MMGWQVVDEHTKVVDQDAAEAAVPASAQVGQSCCCDPNVGLEGHVDPADVATAAGTVAAEAAAVANVMGHGQNGCWWL